MTRTITATVGALMLTAAAAGAQSPEKPRTADPADHAQATAERMVDQKLTGCVQAGTAPGTFELKVNKKDTPAGATQPDVAAAPAGSAAMKAKNVVLAANPGVNLEAHVGHTIEVTGSWGQAQAPGADAPRADTPRAEAPRADAPRADASKADEKGKVFTVSNVKMVSSTCSTGTN